MGTTMDQNAGTIAILEATAEARTLIEDISRLGEELKVRQERLAELLAPSEAALRARTEYLDKVMREELGRAEQRVLRLSQDVEKIACHLNDSVVQMPARLAEADARRWTARERREHWRMVVPLLAMLLGGFLAGLAASYHSGLATNVRTSTVEEIKATKTTPTPPRRPATKRNAAPAR